MQKWEYCAVTGMASEFRRPHPHYPVLWEFTTSGIRVSEIKGDETNKVAATIARLGLEGWEAFGTGTMGGGGNVEAFNHHVIYFKRPID
jgi:hypothetical protein